MRKLRIIVLFLLGASLTSCTKPTKTEKSASPPGSGAKSESKHESFELDPRMIGWREGRSYRYGLRMTSRIALGEQGLLYDFDLVGNIDVDVIDVTGDTASMHIAINDGQFRSRIPAAQPEFDKVANELSQPCFLEMKGGLVTATELPRDLHPMVAAVFRSVGASFQVSRARDPKQSFTATEYDTTGAYVAQYSQQSGSELWHKVKLKYLSILGQKEVAKEVIPDVVRSKGEIELLDDGRPGKINLADELLIKSAQAPIHSSTTVSLTALSIRRVARAKSDWDVLRQRTTRVAANAAYESARDRANLDEAKIGGLTFDQVVNELQAIAARARPTNSSINDPQAATRAARQQADDESKLFVALGAILRRDSSTVEHAVRAIQTRASVSDILVDGLGSADSPQAQRALVRIARSSTYDDKLRVRALISLSRSENATEESIKALQAMVPSELLGSQALYGLGAYCRAAAASGNTQSADNLGKYLIQRLSEASLSEARVILALRAIGNSGYTPALPHVAVFLTDQREQLRADAVRAIATMDSPEVDRKLVERLSDDPSKHVKLAAIEGMISREPGKELVDGLVRATAAEDAHVRYRAVEVMIRWLPKRTELRRNIEAVAQNDSEPKIRELAKAAL